MGRKLLAVVCGAAVGTVIGLAGVKLVRATPSFASQSGPAIYIDDDRADAVRRQT